MLFCWIKLVLDVWISKNYWKNIGGDALKGLKNHYMKPTNLITYQWKATININLGKLTIPQ